MGAAGGWLFFFFRRQNSHPQIIKDRTITTDPTAIPILAPVPRTGEACAVWVGLDAFEVVGMDVLVWVAAACFNPGVNGWVSRFGRSVSFHLI
jgi:hypothetical protein